MTVSKQPCIMQLAEKKTITNTGGHSYEAPYTGCPRKTRSLFEELGISINKSGKIGLLLLLPLGNANVISVIIISTVLKISIFYPLLTYVWYFNLPVVAFFYSNSRVYNNVPINSLTSGSQGAVASLQTILLRFCWLTCCVLNLFLLIFQLVLPMSII